MDSIIPLLGSIGAPEYLLKQQLAPSSTSSSASTTTNINTIATNSLGNIAIIDVNGSIKYGFLQHINDSKEGLKSLLYESSGDDNNIMKCKFTKIEFNKDGTLLLLSSNQSIGVIELSSTNGNHRFKNLTSLINPILIDVNIVKITFHPCSNCHIMVLYHRGPLILYDLISDVKQKINLSKDIVFTSFTFGPSIDWMSVTVFLLTSSGDVYYVCPIVPNGSILARQTIDEMYDWLHEMRQYASTGDVEELDSYLNKVSIYYDNRIGCVSTAPFTRMSSSLMASNSKIDVSNNKIDDSFSNQQQHQGIDGDIINTPILQGPLLVNNTCTKNGSKSNTVACDICTQSISKSSNSICPPLIVVSYADESVEFYLLYSADHGSMIGPAWSRQDISTDIPKCKLIMIDRVESKDINISTADTSSLCNITIVPDPVFSYIFHVSNHQKCRSYIVSAMWIQNIDSVHDGSTKVSSYKSNVFSGNESSLIGSTILFDSILGHVCVFRTISSTICAVNLSVHVRICDVEEILQKLKLKSASSSSLIDVDELVIKHENNRCNELKKLANQANDLINIPHSGSTESISTKLGMEQLSTASAYIEEKIIIPLEELYARLRVRIDSFVELNKIQEDFKDSLLQKLVLLNDAYDEKLNKSMDHIDDVYKTQKESIQSMYLATASSSHVKLTRSEHEYSSKLKQMIAEVEELKYDIERLKLKGLPMKNPTIQSKKDSFKAKFNTPTSLRKSKISMLMSPTSNVTPLSPINSSFSSSRHNHLQQQQQQLQHSRVATAEKTPSSYHSKSEILLDNSFVSAASEDTIEICNRLQDSQSMLMDEMRKKVDEIESKIHAYKIRKEKYFKVNQV